ncbi:hypothetical protein N2600_30725 (plasmid) [Rhizobium sp. WSM1274]|uniref:hypothetical protein n=1 Tax=Rhizobium sp. WSM1274 TaxID=3138254 RepID=UPI0021A60D47|nr:hypothetical protein [Rhizobium leguminosarum]UWU32233.1 hypothetical protein N2600_30725 [Rhizobium leguminosarum bv. viciae]
MSLVLFLFACSSESEASQKLEGSWATSGGCVIDEQIWKRAGKGRGRSIVFSRRLKRHPPDDVQYDLEYPLAHDISPSRSYSASCLLPSNELIVGLE